MTCGAHIVIVRNISAFTSRYPNVVASGVYSGGLKDIGETLDLVDSLAQPVQRCVFTNTWYPTTAGLGFSLVPVNERDPAFAWDKKSFYRVSSKLNGTPCAMDTETNIPAVVLNEALTHTDLPQIDSLEILNTTTNSVNVGGWFLTDDPTTPKKYRIPANTFIVPTGMLVFTEAQFNPIVGVPPSFSLNSAGDEAWIFSADSQTNLTGYAHGWAYGASQNGVSFGRFVNREGKEYFYQQGTNSLGTGNGYPRMWPAAITEIMYNPPPLGTNVNTRDEFIEITSLSPSNVPCYDYNDPTNTWKLTNAVNFTFPTNIILPVDGRILVVGFDPAVATNLAAFRAVYGLSTNVPILGPWTGKLANEGDRVELLRPDPPNSNAVPYVLVEHVSYNDRDPWPDTANGNGRSIQRIEPSAFGNDPYNWYAAAPTPGTSPNLDLDSDGDGVRDWMEWRDGTDPTNATSVLNLYITTTTSNPPCQLTWFSKTNRMYSIERTTNLTGPVTYIPITGTITGLPVVSSFNDTNTSPNAYYRIRVQP